MPVQQTFAFLDTTPAPVLPSPAPLDQLRHRAALIAGQSNLATDASPTMFSTGCPMLDTWLPGGGLAPGALCEWVNRTRDGSGAGTLAMIAAAALIGQCPPNGPPLVVVDPWGQFHAAAAVAWGIPAGQIIWCRTSGRRDTVWTLDQALRCGGVAAVWAMLPWNLEDRDARRLQLAAQAGQTPGLLVRDHSARRHPSFAAVRWPSFAAVRWFVEPVSTPRHPLVLAIPAGKSASVAAQSQLSSSLRPAARPTLDRCRDVRVLRITLDRARAKTGVGTFAGMNTAASLAPLGRQAHLAITDDAHVWMLDERQFALPAPTRHAPESHEAAALPLAAQLARPASSKRRVDRRVG